MEVAEKKLLRTADILGTLHECSNQSTTAFAGTVAINAVAC